MPKRSYLTTFEISRICEVNPTTVQNWVKEKKLPAHVTPGGHRRIRREDLVRFLREFSMPIPLELGTPPPLVLVVDDEQDIIDLVTAALQSGGQALEIVGATSGVEALLIIGERKPDLVILDILMPGMNGIEVCQTLKASPVTRNLRIVAVSGRHDPDLRARVLAAGADHFFTKPLDLLAFRSECLRLTSSPGER